MSFSDHVAACFARYDSVAMRPPSPAAPAAPAVPTAHWQALQAWCFAGTGPGCAPLLQPGALPQVPQRFAMAQWQGANAVVEAWALDLDGSALLDRQPGAAGRLLLRLRTKRNDACWWRPRQATDPWDAGHLIAGDAAARHLQQHFQPRRATLLLVGTTNAPQLADSMRALQQRSAGFRYPVRLLCLADAPVPTDLAADLAPIVTRLAPPG